MSSRGSRRGRRKPKQKEREVDANSKLNNDIMAQLRRQREAASREKRRKVGPEGSEGSEGESCYTSGKTSIKGAGKSTKFETIISSRTAYHPLGSSLINCIMRRRISTKLNR